MKKLSYLFLIVALFLVTCKGNDDNCAPVACPAVFNTVRLYTQTQSGVPKEVKMISAKNMHSGKTFTPIKEENRNDGLIAYIIATDNEKMNFMENGVRVIITTTTSKKVTTEMIITGGKCVCGISQISGPTTLTVD